MDDLIGRMRRDLDDITPSASFDDLRARITHRERRRRFRAGALGIAIAAVVIVGAWTAADRRADRSTTPATPAPAGAADRLFLAGDGEAWVVDPTSETAQRLTMPELSPGDAPYRVVRRADALVAWAYRTLIVQPEPEPTFDVLVPDSLFFIPSSSPDRVWVAISDESQEGGRLTAVREVSIDGQVTVPDARPPDGAWPVAAVDRNLVFQKEGELVVWNPSTGKEVDRLPGQLPVAWDGALLAWCDDVCSSLHMKDLRSGGTMTVQPPAGATGFEALQGRFSPDGSTLAVAVSLGHGKDAERQLALIDVGTGRITIVDEAIVSTPYVFIDWTPSGGTVYITGGQLAGHRQIVEYTVGDAAAHVLDVTVGDFFGMAAYRAEP